MNKEKTAPPTYEAKSDFQSRKKAISQNAVFESYNQR